MTHQQQSIHINLVTSISLKRNDSFFDDSLNKTSILVKSTDQVSTIFDAIGFTNRQNKIVFNGQVLCPTLTFDFYNIHNNDTISLISPRIPISISITDLSMNDHTIFAVPCPLPISNKRSLHHSNSSNHFNKMHKSIMKNSNKKDDLQDNELSIITKINDIRINTSN